MSDSQNEKSESQCEMLEVVSPILPPFPLVLTEEGYRLASQRMRLYINTMIRLLCTAAEGMADAHAMTPGAATNLKTIFKHDCWQQYTVLDGQLRRMIQWDVPGSPPVIS